MTAVLTNEVVQLPADFIESYRNHQVPWGPIGYITYKRTYARPIIPASLVHIDSYHEQLQHWRRMTNDPEAHFTTEEWWQTTARCVNWYLKQAAGTVTVEEGMALYDDIMNLRCSFSGRGLWQCGTKTVETLGSASLNNCYGINVDSLEAFLFTFDMLMLGGGVGFNIQKEFVFSIPPVVGCKVTRKESRDADFIVPDSREGWIELLRRTLYAYFTEGSSPFSYSTICIRPSGSPIAGFGGVASGPEPLCTGISQICQLLDKRVGKKLRPIDCLDIMNIIGSVVVAGNVRRSAELALGDHEDNYFLLAKRFDLSTPVPNWRSMSNNSVACSTLAHLPDKFWKTYDVGGEPYGLVNLGLMRKKGRIRDTHRTDEGVTVCNPCAEVTLESGESCNLAEIFVPNIRSQDEFVAVATRIWKVCKVVACVRHHWGFANDVIQRNLRTGLGQTGVLQLPMDVVSVWSDAGYAELEKIDEVFSAQLSQAYGRKINKSIKLTTIKPSGTLSLLAGVSPGIHPEYASFYIRRIRIAATSPIIEACRKAGYHIEPAVRFDGSNDLSTMVVSFPVKAREGSIVAKDMNALAQLEVAKTMQHVWSDNSVSVTIYYRTEELPAIKAWLAANYDDNLKTVSFLLHNEHGFRQAPYEEITEKEFLRRSKHLIPLDLSGSHDELYDVNDCATGACPIR